MAGDQSKRKLPGVEQRYFPGRREWIQVFSRKTSEQETWMRSCIGHILLPGSGQEGNAHHSPLGESSSKPDENKLLTAK